MKGLSIVVLLFLAMVCTAGCDKGGVTETGNPCPTGNCPPANSPTGEQPSDTGEEGNLAWYHDATSDVTVGYPQNWLKSDAAGDDGMGGSCREGGCDTIDAAASLVAFASSDPQPTSVTVTFRKLSRPMSLEDITQGYPACFADRGGGLCQFGGNPNMEGYVCDETSPGPGGSDIVSYFFLNDTAFVHVSAEVFDAGRAGLAQLVASIKPE